METMTVELGGIAYSVVAVEGDDGLWRPDVAVVGADGEPGRKLVDAETTDEAYRDARACLLHAVAIIV